MRYDLVLEQGANFQFQTIHVDSDGEPINLTGYTALMQVRRSPQSATVLLELTTASAEILLGGSAGTISLAVSAADTADVPEGFWQYDLLLTSGAGVKTRALFGSVLVTAAVSKEVVP